MNNDIKTTLTAGEKTVEMTEENVNEYMSAGKVSAGKDSNPIQLVLDLDFKVQYSDLALREAVRGIKAITRETIRLGAGDVTVSAMLSTLAIGHPIVYAAVDAIEEQIERAAEARERVEK